MAKKKSKKSHAGARGHNPFKKKTGGHRRRHAGRNPLLPVESKRLPGLVGGGLVGAVSASWVPALILPTVTGWLSFLLNAVVAILGAWALGAVGAPNAALGFLIGGLSATAGLVLDKVTGKQIISVSAPMGQFYRQSGAYLPSGIRGDLTNNPLAQPALPAVIPSAGSQKAKTMGWSRMRRYGG
jgi:hypothetical protein